MKNLESPIKSSRILLVESCFNTNKAESLRSVQRKRKSKEKVLYKRRK